MLPGIIWGIYVPRNMKDINKTSYKKSKVIFYYQQKNFKLQILFFFFGTVEQLLKVLFYLSTGFSFWKKTLETKTLP